MNLKLESIVIAASLFSCVLCAYAMPEGFEPFEDGQYPQPASVEVKDLGYDMRFRSEKYPSRVEIEFKSSPNRKLILDFKDDPECFYLTMASIDDGTGKAIMPPIRIERCSPSVIYSVDINGDGVPDYGIYTFSTACGYGVTDSLAFIVSSGKTYEYAGTINTMCPEKRDFVALRDGKAAMVFTSLVDDVEDSDHQYNALINGRELNFFVYNLIRFEGSKLVSANSLDSRFPRWVQDSPKWNRDLIKSNHEDTELLTGAQRVKWFLSTRFQTKGIEVLQKEQVRVHNLKAWMNGNKTAIFIAMGFFDVSIFSFLIFAFLKGRRRRQGAQ